ncbi:sialic acid synthase [Caerostris darwini]|uniref:Sialic acid synthase n=1 Tax=Caerostris darwini TaxID=1538125 RepID=A0AAV4T8M3_9ARAC|nr:sialic acid synthase [Caerostris darwini]
MHVSKRFFKINLNCLEYKIIKTYKDLFPGAVIGYSGHESGTAVSLAAVSTGAKILERHITLDHTLKGSDHKSSLNEPQLKCLVSEIRKIERAMGCHIKTLQNCEMPCKKKLGKTIVASKFLITGTVLNDSMMDVKVAVISGYDPIMFYDLIGRKLKCDVNEEETIVPMHLE